MSGWGGFRVNSGRKRRQIDVVNNPQPLPPPASLPTPPPPLVPPSPPLASSSRNAESRAHMSKFTNNPVQGIPRSSQLAPTRLYSIFAPRAPPSQSPADGAGGLSPQECDSHIQALRVPQSISQAGTISDSDLAALLADLNLASPPESENVIDETLLADPASSGLEDVVEPESQPEAEKGSMCEGFLQTLVAQLRNEINRFGRPIAYEHGSFWQRAREPIFALDAARMSDGGMNPRELYMLDTFLWLPGLKTKLPGEPDILKCPRVNCTGRLTRKGYNSNPTARRVRGLHRDYFLTNRLECNLAACGKSYQGTDPRIVSQLSRELQESFPAFITARAAIDKNLLSLMRGVFNSRCGPKPFSDVLSEMHHLDHAQRELIYVAALRSSPTPIPASPEQFSTYDDKLRFCGSTPSANYCKAVFVDWMQAHRQYHDRVTASLPGKILRGDHTFKALSILSLCVVSSSRAFLQLIKLLALLNGVPTHVALYTVVNEWEEIRGQYLVLTKELAYVEECYKKMMRSLELHGHEPTQLMWSDNARAERAFHERCIPSLKNGVVHIQHSTYSNLPPLTVESDQFTFLSHPDLIDATCYQILRRAEDSKIVLALTIEHKMQPDGQGSLIAAAGQAGVDLIGLATAEDMYLFKVSTLNSVARIPPNLLALLKSDRTIKVGHQTSIDLGRLAKTKGAVSDAKASLPTLAGCVLGKSIRQTNVIQLSDWSAVNLSPSQLSYAAVKLHATHLVWRSLMRDPSVGLPVYSLASGTLVDIRGGATKIVARGQILEQPAIGSHIQIQHGTGDFEKKVKLTANRVLVQVDEILIPGYEPALHKLALGNFGPLPFNIVMVRSMIVTRKSTSPVSITSGPEGFNIPDDFDAYDPLENVLGPNDISENLGPSDYIGIDGRSIGSREESGDEEGDEDDVTIPNTDIGAGAAEAADNGPGAMLPIVAAPGDSDDEYAFMDGVELANLMVIYE
ncbi:Werner syndrome ATP-dependent helicase [Favolaschia claudopus]|uniref:Werner syndrome ATP-dependent helicase n=1 Tax=Favolaschia claudopus TaxID=2862362 RepID=A0AAW0A9T2_9AGAR